VPSEPLELNPVAAKALDLLFILHADHEQNASTSTVRLVGSTGANPYAASPPASPRCGARRTAGANEAVLKMLAEIGRPRTVGQPWRKPRTRSPASA
jgi:citrate synthase